MFILASWIQCHIPTPKVAREETQPSKLDFATGSRSIYWFMKKSNDSMTTLMVRQKACRKLSSRQKQKLTIHDIQSPVHYLLLFRRCHRQSPDSDQILSRLENFKIIRARSEHCRVHRAASRIIFSCVQREQDLCFSRKIKSKWEGIIIKIIFPRSLVVCQVKFSISFVS